MKKYRMTYKGNNPDQCMCPFCYKDAWRSNWDKNMDTNKEYLKRLGCEHLIKCYCKGGKYYWHFFKKEGK